ncbi:hypothetical protein BPTFM16_01527 [Altererythrobacter insulae]|nr:hypothetical protein BPTFM16_01527 [Altererythrobacter insulae]
MLSGQTADDPPPTLVSFGDSPWDRAPIAFPGGFASYFRLQSLQRGTLGTQSLAAKLRYRNVPVFLYEWPRSIRFAFLQRAIKGTQ